MINDKMSMEEAKELYFKYDCNGYYMFREDDRYLSFMDLNIPKDILAEWDKEWMAELTRRLKSTGNRRLYGKIYEIAECFHESKYPEMIDGLFEYIHFETQIDRYVIAEELMGAYNIKARRGMVFWSMREGRPDIALRMLEKAKMLLDSIGEHSERYEEDMRDYGIISTIVREDIRNGNYGANCNYPG